MHSFSPMSCYRKDMDPAEHHPYHKHDCFEIMYSNKGEFVLHIMDKDGSPVEYIIKTNEFVCLSGLVPHFVTIDTACNVSNIEIAIVPRTPQTMHIDYYTLLTGHPSLRECLLSSVTCDILNDTSSMSFILNSLIKVFSSKKGAMDDLICQSLLYRLLLELHQCQEFSSSKDTGVVYIRSAMQYINENILSDISAANVIAHVGVSASYLQRLFKNHFQLGILHCIYKRKIDLAKNMLSETNGSIHEIYQKFGFKNLAQFVYEFKRFIGCTPIQFKEKLGNETIVNTLKDYRSISVND